MINEDNWYIKISGHKMSNHLCEHCHLNLTEENKKFCRSCEVHFEMVEEFKELDRLNGKII